MVGKSVDSLSSHEREKIIHKLENIKSKANKKEMYNTYEPQRSESNQSIRKKRTMISLDTFANNIGRCQKEKYNRIDKLWYTKISYHKIPMNKNIGIEREVNQYKYWKIKKKYRMAHK